MSSEIKLQVKDKQTSAHLADGKGPGVLVLHAWWGLKPFFKKFCDRLAAQGFTVLAPDLYYGRIGTTIDEAKALNQEMEENNVEQMAATVKAAKDHLAALRPGKPIAVLGFSMGTWWSLVTAASEKDVAAGVLFYGTGGSDPKDIQAKILGHYAETDQFESMENVRSMEAAMKGAGLNVTIHVYPKTEHWFMEEDRPEYNAAAAQLAWDRTVEFLNSSLRA